MENWEYFDQFESINNRYLPNMGEGETMANQIVTAVNKLIYKWYNDGDVYDNTFGMSGWGNDLSSYANWLYYFCDCQELTEIANCCTDVAYEAILRAIADLFLNEEYLEEMDKKEKIGTIYKCDGPFHFEEEMEDDEDDWYEDPWEEEEEI